MAVVGFYFTKIHGEKKTEPNKKLSVDRAVNIQKVEKSDIAFGAQKQGSIVVSFSYEVTYAPEIGKIELNGNLLYLAQEERLEETLAQWKKESTLPLDIMNPILQAIFTRANIQALVMSRDLTLPPPFAIPTPRMR